MKKDKDRNDVFKNMTSEIFQTGLDQFGADLSCIQPREPVCSLSKNIEEQASMCTSSCTGEPSGDSDPPGLG